MPQVRVQGEAPQERGSWEVSQEMLPFAQEEDKPPFWIQRILQFKGSKIPSDLLPNLGAEIVTAVEGESISRVSLHEPIDLTGEVQNAMVEIQNMGVRITKPNEVFDYLLRFSGITDVTVEIAGSAHQRLPEAQLLLEVYRDPEVEDEYLALYARFREYDESVMDKIKAIRRGHSERLVGKEGWLLFTTDFQPAE